MKKIIYIIVLFLVSNIVAQDKQIESLTIRGAKKTKIEVIKRIIASKGGGVLDSILLNKDIIRLKRLPAISHAYYQVFHSTENKYNVFINIEENFTIIPEVNVWTTTNKKTAYKLGVYDYNFLGRNITFGGFYQNNGFDSYGVNIIAPTLFSRRWGLALNHQNWASEEPLFFNGGSANYKYQNISYEVLGLFELNFKNHFQFGVNFFKEKYNYLSGQTDPSIPQVLNLNKTLFKTIYTYNRCVCETYTVYRISYSQSKPATNQTYTVSYLANT